MAQVLVRNLDDEVVARLKRRAADNRRSLEAEVRAVLTDATRPAWTDMLAEADRIRSGTVLPAPGQPGAVELIRQDRDTR